MIAKDYMETGCHRDSHGLNEIEHGLDNDNDYLKLVEVINLEFITETVTSSVGCRFFR